MTRFEIIGTSFPGLNVLRHLIVGDARGYLERVFCEEDLRPLIGGRRIAQINRTVTARRGTVRGMHFQHPPHAEMKFVTCLRGEIFDVAVDLRRGSSTFLQWHAETLSAANYRTMVIPEGFAHGFQTRCDDCELLYLHTAAYHPEAEGRVHAQDPVLAINWPEKVSDLSSRDASLDRLPADFRGLTL
jgi:dTDP-4-dehydrorhamnose 3,5-epimerase